MKFYICGKDEGVYYLVTENGECLGSHYCSSKSYAYSDLYYRRTDSKKEWKERFGDFEVLHLGGDDMTEEELLKRNKIWFETEEN